MNWQPTTTQDALILRARLNRLIRDFFAGRGVLEVETPLLSRAGNTDPNIDSFVLGVDGRPITDGPRRWLRTSPEFALKRLLAAGVGDCYELGRVFRRGETGRRHNPEFTMLEWYRLGFDHHRLMDEVAQLLQAALSLVERQVAVRRFSYAELFIEFATLDPHSASDAMLADALAGFDVRADDLSRDDLLNLLLTHRIEPLLPVDELLLIYDFPQSQAALARVRAGDPPLAERFEAYLGGYELANGYHELTDAAEQRRRFEADLQLRRSRSAITPTVDENLLNALDSGLPACAGVALGVDRLLMAMLGTREIADVIAFPDSNA